jgi:2-polyprenyl-6-methoxyphenol hydroxylase-like FAD-dependent oxidoreductase
VESPPPATTAPAERLDAPVLIVGGGIGGLAAANALRRANVPVVVFERSPELLAIGGAIQIWANGMRALDELGLADPVRESGMPIENQSFRSWRGSELANIPTGELARKYGIDPPTMLRRGDLLGILAAGLGDGTTRFGTEVTSFEQDADGVTVSLSGGGQERGSVLIGADGLDSKIRTAVFPDSPEPRFAGYQYLRALAKFDGFPDGLFTFTLGRGDRFGAHDVSPGWLYWFGVLVNEPGTGDPPRASKAELLERFRDFPEPIPQIIEGTPEEDIMRTDIRDVSVPRWSDGRVTLLGDAAHATTPNLGRGAGEALEDAVAIARSLTSTGSPPEALAAYEGGRREAAAGVQKRSRRIGGLLSVGNPLAVKGREFVFRRFAGKGLVRDTDKEFAELASRRGSQVPSTGEAVAGASQQS